jgi:hypothetical protein
MIQRRPAIEAAGPSMFLFLTRRALDHKSHLKRLPVDLLKFRNHILREGPPAGPAVTHVELVHLLWVPEFPLGSLSFDSQSAHCMFWFTGAAVSLLRSAQGMVAATSPPPSGPFLL